MERTTRHYHPKCYILLTSSTNIYQQNFYYRAIHDWNALLFDFDKIDKMLISYMLAFLAVLEQVICYVTHNLKPQLAQV